MFHLHLAVKLLYRMPQAHRQRHRIAPCRTDGLSSLAVDRLPAHGCMPAVCKKKTTAGVTAKEMRLLESSQAGKQRDFVLIPA